MAKLGYSPTTIAPPDKFNTPDELVEYLTDLSAELHSQLVDLFTLVDGQLSIKNLYCYEYLFQNPSYTADTEFSITHNMGKICRYYIWNVMQLGGVHTAAGIIYRGDTTWTTTTAYFKYTAANPYVNFLLLFW